MPRTYYRRLLAFLDVVPNTGQRQMRPYVCRLLRWTPLLKLEDDNLHQGELLFRGAVCGTSFGSSTKLWLLCRGRCVPRPSRIRSVAATIQETVAPAGSCCTSDDEDSLSSSFVPTPLCCCCCCWTVHRCTLSTHYNNALHKGIIHTVLYHSTAHVRSRCCFAPVQSYPSTVHVCA